MIAFLPTRAILLAIAVIVAGGVIASCNNNDADAKQQDEMKKGFSGRPPISQLPPEQKQRAEAMRQMAEQMAQGGPGAPRPTAPK